MNHVNDHLLDIEAQSEITDVHHDVHHDAHHDGQTRSRKNTEPRRAN
jgi:hypothetical protein